MKKVAEMQDCWVSKRTTFGKKGTSHQKIGMLRYQNIWKKAMKFLFWNLRHKKSGMEIQTFSSPINLYAAYNDWFKVLAYRVCKKLLLINKILSYANFFTLINKQAHTKSYLYLLTLQTKTGLQIKIKELRTPVCTETIIK